MENEGHLFQSFQALQARGRDLLAFGLSTEKLVLGCHKIEVFSLEEVF